MAPVAATVALSHVEGISDSARARELYKYYQPTAPINTETCFPAPPSSTEPGNQNLEVQSDITSTKISSPDTSLTAFCQLVSWRLEVQRAMISLIDDGTQYFIAESTKSLNLVDATKHKPGDELWLGCTSVSKAGRLCERTIETAPTASGDEYPSFIVNDLTLDDRFNQLSFVTDPPHLKFYAGVPLITKRGIPIGSLFVVDSQARPGLSKDDISFLGTMACTVMKHLELNREVEEHRRGMKMSRGLASFVEGRAELEEADMEAEDGEGTKIVGQFETDTGIRRQKSKSSSSTKDSRMSSATSLSLSNGKEKGHVTSTSTIPTRIEGTVLTSERSDSFTNERPGMESTPYSSYGETSTTEQSPSDMCKTDTPDEEFTEASALKLLFSRASNLIREAFEVDGGAVFYDAQKGFSSDAQTSNLELSVTDSQTSGDDEMRNGFNPQSSISRPFTRASTMSQTREIEILGFSTPEASSINGDLYPGTHSFLPFEEKSLHQFLRRYPRGKLWTFDSDGSMSSASDDELLKSYKSSVRPGRNQQRGKNKVARAAADGRFLSNHFPGVRQLLFVPLWDAGRSRWLSACCVWSTEPTRILSKQNELSFLTAFGNSVMAECSRISTEVADQKKSDFIGSISHELRSPLHGILASAEILDDLSLPNLAQELVETIDSCGRTLLDTINHILDFSKISSLEKNWRRNRRGSTKRRSQSSSAGPLALQQSDLPMINLFAPVDVAVLCEEVVESVFAGYVFQNVTAKTFDMVHDIHDKSSDSKRQTGLLAMSSSANQTPQVSVILDIALDNYNFTTQPGAFRRIIMNLLGNALKYTSHGYVRVKLETAKLDDLNVPGDGRTPRSMIILTVTDTGKGISSEFLRSKLFTPFAQENTLSSGTGLGLSIVRSIINLLEGDITIDSELGRGTEVRVTLPLLREMPKDTSTPATPKAVTSLLRETDESVSLLRSEISGREVGLFNFNPPTIDPILARKGKFLEGSVRNFLTNWYGSKIVPLSKNPAIILANAPDLSVLANLRKMLPRQSKPSVLVLCPHSSRFNHSFAEAGIEGNVTVVAKPVGPLKLARALRSCLEGVTAASGTAVTPDASGMAQGSTNDLSNIFEDLLISPNGGEVLDNSRMAVDSENARKAIESPTPNALVEKGKEFPFPLPLGGKNSSSNGELSLDKNLLTPIASSFGLSSPPNSSVGCVTSHPSGSSTATATTRQPSITIADSDPFAPNLLLVDDNMINLKLLRHFITRLGYTTVHEAENGLEAVKKVEERPEGYDIIFMDISMPILDGFDATKEIRKLEKSRRERATTDDETDKSKKKNEALVVALTGLAGKDDVEKARACGIDLFMTKPVAMKEVRKMLENWRANQKD
ncbi:putative two-component sensor protein histidine protein kinase (dhkj) protein [Botrytis fragariae]|uniref:Putative two-component sensor protein histidine protein kinase (Dhkj) protein n=1 Tax=Botrytis fragariae TaxID=1964551 RepID=A0A8H6B415_9HELO|nr:putative two-component sensor protein histidine protein kinase (dhkj) protein [Botrytis fragariae]KAF5879053.1 putative two-component sensor protein histidine protein kinase (dhkj) protein [Botrytis fragariae]